MFTRMISSSVARLIMREMVKKTELPKFLSRFTTFCNCPRFISTCSVDNKSKNQLKYRTKKQKMLDPPVPFEESKPIIFDWEEVKKYPQIGHHDEETITQYLEFMSMYSFNFTQAIEIIAKCPDILENYEELIKEAHGLYRSFGLSTKKFCTVVSRVPAQLGLPESTIKDGYTILNSYFTTEEMINLVTVSPSSLAEHADLIRPKLEFLVKGMCQETPTLSKSNCLKLSLPFMQMRFEFLIRAGLFKPKRYAVLHKLKKQSKAIEKPLTVFEILLSTDSVFLKKCTKGVLNIEELVAFEELFTAEGDKEVDFEDDKKKANDNDYSEESDSEDEEEAEVFSSTSYMSREDSVNVYY